MCTPTHQHTHTPGLTYMLTCAVNKSFLLCWSHQHSVGTGCKSVPLENLKLLSAFCWGYGISFSISYLQFISTLCVVFTVCSKRLHMCVYTLLLSRGSVLQQLVQDHALFQQHSPCWCTFVKELQSVNTLILKSCRGWYFVTTSTVSPCCRSNRKLGDQYGITSVLKWLKCDPADFILLWKQQQCFR